MVFYVAHEYDERRVCRSRNGEYREREHSNGYYYAWIWVFRQSCKIAFFLSCSEWPLESERDLQSGNNREALHLWTKWIIKMIVYYFEIFPVDYVCNYAFRLCLFFGLLHSVRRKKTHSYWTTQWRAEIKLNMIFPNPVRIDDFKTMNFLTSEFHIKYNKWIFPNILPEMNTSWKLFSDFHKNCQSLDRRVCDGQKLTKNYFEHDFSISRIILTSLYFYY